MAFFWRPFEGYEEEETKGDHIKQGRTNKGLNQTRKIENIQKKIIWKFSDGKLSGR